MNECHAQLFDYYTRNGSRIALQENEYKTLLGASWVGSSWTQAHSLDSFVEKEVILTVLGIFYIKKNIFLNKKNQGSII